ncbi:Uncharacterized protein D0Z07_6338 [Hyphodiscus hymeniophilus]|uniref:Uncharacterized protein n=1 Tax=Hyphodiscus hymeniophilus TaxID=353542 RepID=A0A9P6VFC1_9HELO|nr:Uncharacterized protein D0Z07_6338 [Hyphodiscus hymeniophilus]
MALTDYFKWGQQPTTNMDTALGDEDAAEVDEPPDHRSPQTEVVHPEVFHKSHVRPQSGRKESLLTKALHRPETDTKSDIHVAADLSRRRSMMSNASLASTAELTSDGGLTSPARTNTPSPPFPKTTYTSFASYSVAAKTSLPSTIPVARTEPMIPISPEIVAEVSVSPMTQSPVVAKPRPSCIRFACGSKVPVTKAIAPPATVPAAEEPKRQCRIKFACGNNSKSSTAKPSRTETTIVEAPKISSSTTPKVAETVKRNGARSPSMTRKSPRPNMPARSQRDSSSTIRRASQSPVAVRMKSKYIDLDEKTIQSSEATRFHEFASEQMEEDDWIRKESDNPRKRLTINDTLKMENAIRRLGNEAEEEALEEDEEEDEDGEEDDSEEDNDFEEDDDDGDSMDRSDEDASDGNETDNEAGFADSDDESDGGEFAFWTPSRKYVERETAPHRASAHRTASASSIDSLNHMSPPQNTNEARIPRRRPIKIRPGTPDLPDSTDFVCGTLDEDRPLEDAYVSCMEARKFAKHKRTPQDIDPSFPTSEPDDEEDEHDVLEPANDSEENVWLHGKFEDSDEEQQGRRRSVANRRKSPAPSPRRPRSPAPNGRRLHSPPPPARRMHSPPPPKTRLRSPPPRKLFGHSPKRINSPPPARTIRSPAGSPTFHATSLAIPFAPLGSRPGLTHTKSLPRTPNPFCRQYRASQLAAANGNGTDEGTDGHVRKAIDIVKGLERKRHYRKEKLYKGKGKNQPERRPLPGKGAERMREVGLHMAGKTTGAQAPYMLSA